MKMTIQQLADLTWSIERIHDPDHYLEEFNSGTPEAFFNSYATGLCLLRCIEHPEMTYEIDWVAQGGERNLSEAYRFKVQVHEQGQNLLDTGGIEIVDEDGDPITSDEAVRQAGNDIENSVCWEHEVSKHLPELGTEDIDIDEDSDMETITLENHHGPDIRIQGENVASASSYHYEGPRNTRWTELTLYRTRGTQWVCHEVGRTRWEGEHDRFRTHVANSDSALIEALGYGRLAKELYDEAGIKHAKIID